jgi:hypothetical protein
VGHSRDEGAGKPFDLRAHTETWEDMVRLQGASVYPAAFAAITSPVLMLHSTYDPHLGQMIRASLAPFLSQWEYGEWERCGHHPCTTHGARSLCVTSSSLSYASGLYGNWLSERGAASAGYVIRLSGDAGRARSCGLPLSRSGTHEESLGTGTLSHECPLMIAIRAIGFGR